uniref:Uncharacterized protein n=1 Tax=Arundo donax TaxID=35708 RepID=A0A0A8YXU2_ARUDO
MAWPNVYIVTCMVYISWFLAELIVYVA